MAHEVQVLYWCDLCLVDDKNVEADEPIAITIDKLGPLTLDLCGEHRLRLVEPLRDVVSTHGAKPQGEGSKADKARRHRKHDRLVGPFKCQVPGCTSPRLKHRDSLGVHVLKLHQMPMEQYVATYGEPVPVEVDDNVEEVVASCTHCEKTYSNRETRWPRSALVAHLRGKHGIRLLPDGTEVPIAAPTE